MNNENSLQKSTAEMESTERLRSGATFRPNVDICESEQELTVYADLPGVDPRNIDIRFEQGVLTLEGTLAPRDEGDGYLLREYDVGDFRRTFQVSESVDSEAITAEHKDGVLTLHLPKVSAARPRRIEVNASGS
jgi:HSP20 family protein